MLLLYLMLGQLHLPLQVFVCFLLCLSLGLVQDGFFDDDSHHVLVVEVIFAELQCTEDFLPFWWYVFCVEGTISKVERNRRVLFERNNFGLLLLLWLFASKEVLNPTEEAVLLLLLASRLQVALLHLLVLLNRRAIRKDLELHQFRLS